MLELKIKQGRRHVPIFDLPAYLGRAAAAQELGDTIDSLIAFLDDLGGDPDIEETDCEDSFVLSSNALAYGNGYPGCPISDIDCGVEDDPAGIDPEEDMEHDGREPDEHVEEFSDAEAYRDHKRWLQRARCMPLYRYRRDFRTGEVIGRDLMRYQLLYDVPAPSRRQLISRKRGMPRRPRP